MNRSLFLLLVLLLTGCASFQVSTLNHDPIYSIEGSDAEITRPCANPTGATAARFGPGDICAAITPSHVNKYTDSILRLPNSRFVLFST